MDHFLILTEGVHDQALIQKLLKVVWGLERFDGQRDKLDSFWVPLIPKYPKDGKLYSRVAFPAISFSAAHSIAIYATDGIDKRIYGAIHNLGSFCPDLVAGLQGCGVIVDANHKGPQVQFARLKCELAPYLPNLPQQPGEVSTSLPRQGIYVLPDNDSTGSLEDVLLQCAMVVYPDLLAGAQTYLAQVPAPRKKHWEGSDAKKALVGCIGNVLRPAKTNTVTISDNDWISDQTKELAALVALQSFLGKLLGLATLTNPH